MAMEITSRSVRLGHRASSIRLRRSCSSVLVSELVSSEIGKITGYERLSGFDERQRKTRSWAFLSKAFNFWKVGGGGGGVIRRREAEGKKKTRSSWLPDPDRRWPVQGW
ncbi:hypothetical protein Acr_05g0000180 [Actinidia rufa]|uniref:Uncharacterized protein n=1 Tax=Actinidia rufa TaxID=165716 RepID=A0A7J0EKC7_9ERIC|nr:hypothetical protein Acr_05g0000180 [Actinidia rufa]